MTNSPDTEERLDRLAEHLGRTVQLLQAGAAGVAVKDQLAKLHRSLLEVVKDTNLDPTDVVHREIDTGAPPAASIPAPRPAAGVPAPFRPVDLSYYVTSQA